MRISHNEIQLKYFKLFDDHWVQWVYLYLFLLAVLLNKSQNKNTNIYFTTIIISIIIY